MTILAAMSAMDWNLLNQRAARMYGIVPGPLRSWIRDNIATSDLLPAAARRKLGHTFVGRDNRLESLYLDNFYCAFSKTEQDRLLQQDAGPIYRTITWHVGTRGPTHVFCPVCSTPIRKPTWSNCS